MRILEPAADDLDSDRLVDLHRPPDGPHLRINMVSSADGAVTIDGRVGGLTSAPDQQLLGLLRSLCDVLLVAAGTVRAEGYGGLNLPAEHQQRRLERGLPADPVLAIVTASARLRPDDPVFTEATRTPVVLTTTTADADHLAPVATVLRHGSDRVDLAAGIADLRARFGPHLLGEGGPSLNHSLLSDGLVDEVCWTISPQLVAGDGPGMVAGPPLDPPRRLRPVSTLQAGDELMTRWQVLPDWRSSPP